MEVQIKKLFLACALTVFSAGWLCAREKPVIIGGNYSAVHASPSAGLAPHAVAAEETAPAPKTASAAQPVKTVQPVKAAYAPKAAVSERRDAPAVRTSAEYLEMAKKELIAKEYEAAVTDATRAIQLSGSNLNAYLARSSAYSMLGAYEKSAADANFVISVDPNNAIAYNLRGWNSFQTGATDAAMQDISHALALNKSLASAYYNRSFLWEKQGQYRRMVDDLRAASLFNAGYTEKLTLAMNKYALQLQAEPETQQPAASSEAPAPKKQPVNWTKIYIILGSLAVGVFIAMQVLAAMAARKKQKQRADMLKNQYQIVRQLGEGGMGLVYEAIDSALKRRVAIKQLRSEIGMSEAAKEQFLDEARTVASLRHPNIVEIYTVFEERGDLFLVFEYVSGQTLETRLDLEGTMSFREAKPIYEAVCKALAYAHANNFIHRDLKPANIMISDAGFIKVMDFGVARNIINSYGTKNVSGTPAYMAPEQAKGLIRKESDIFSLGVCLYETLVGHVPWEIDGYDAAAGRIVPPSAIVSSVPKDVDNLIEMCLQTDYKRRLPTANQFWQILNSIKA